MNFTLHSADSRGQSRFDWLDARHTFSFGEYRDAERVRFGLLRVINDDLIRPAGGFGMHPHANMEIVTIPLSGELRHEDTLGNVRHIRAGEVQIMSAGTGLLHSEFNASERETANILQIWVFPKRRDIEPRYEQKNFPVGERHNRLQNIAAPDPAEGGVVINQDAWFWRGDFDAGENVSYRARRAGNGIYLFVIDGSVTVGPHTVNARDGLAIAAAEDDKSHRIELQLTTDTASQLLIMDIPS